MAHFARLDENNIVVAVHVVSNNALDPNNEEYSGIAFLTELHGHDKWKQTSYNSSFRGTYAGVGYSYSEEDDIFIPPQPFQSWILDKTICVWIPPIPYPQDENDYEWNESTLSWDLLDF